MKRLILISILFISIAHVYGQRDTIWISKQKDWRAYTFQFDWDTVYFISDQISCPLQGTIKIPWSKNQEFVRDAGSGVVLAQGKLGHV